MVPLTQYTIHILPIPPDQCPVFLTNLEGKVGKVGKVGRVGKVGKVGKEGRLRE